MVLELVGKCQTSYTCWMTYPRLMASWSSGVGQVPMRQRSSSVWTQR